MYYQITLVSFIIIRLSIKAHSILLFVHNNDLSKPKTNIAHSLVVPHGVPIAPTGRVPADVVHKEELCMCLLDGIAQIALG